MDDGGPRTPQERITAECASGGRAALILAPPLLDWADRRPPLDPARYVAARLLDDAAYSLGVWQGCLARRTVRPLLPVIGARRQPGSPALPGRRQPGGTAFPSAAGRPW